MIIYIELLVPLAIMGLLVFWYFWYHLSKRRLLKKYDETKDRSKGGEEQRRRSASVEEPVINTERLEESITGGFLQAPAVDAVREDKPSPRKTGKSTRGIFAKLRRRS